MKLLLLSFMAVMLMAGCAEESAPQVRFENEGHCLIEEDRLRLSEFIVDCSKAANPLSDEEGEDLVLQCENTGRRVVCPEHIHRKTYENYVWTTQEVVLEEEPVKPLTVQPTTTHPE